MSIEQGDYGQDAFSDVKSIIDYAASLALR